MIHYLDVYKTYKPGLFKKNINAVNGLTLKVNRGEVFGLVGPNGAGKSTTIRLLLGLIRPNSGKIFFDGKPLVSAGLQDQIGYLPENPYLYDHLSLLELLDFCGKASGINRDVISERTNDLIKRLKLEDAQKRPLRSFSKGMLQRAGICFALLHDPEVIILDEPMSGLDPLGRRMVIDLIGELKFRGKTIFFCSHILNDVERLCDRIGLMNKGRLVKLFDRRDFAQLSGDGICLKITALTEIQKKMVLNIGAEFRQDGDDQLLWFPSQQYFDVNNFLQSEDIAIIGSRPEFKSLEDQFIQAVRGGTNE